MLSSRRSYIRTASYRDKSNAGIGLFLGLGSDGMTTEPYRHSVTAHGSIITASYAYIARERLNNAGWVGQRQEMVRE